MSPFLVSLDTECKFPSILNAAIFASCIYVVQLKEMFYGAAAMLKFLDTFANAWLIELDIADSKFAKAWDRNLDELQNISRNSCSHGKYRGH